MKQLQLILVLLLTFTLACKNEKPIELDYCDMLSKDQSYVNKETTDTAVIERNRRLRHQIFVENYTQIVRLTKQSGFPNFDFEALPQDSCKNWALTATLIHMAQAKPEIFFSTENIALLSSEIDKGNLDSSDLFVAFKVSFVTNQFCEELRENINMAITKWRIKDLENTEANYKSCE